MNNIDLLLDESKEIIMDLEIQGASTKNLKTRMIIETGDGFDITFGGIFDSVKSSTTFHIPILAQTLVPQTYKCSVEVILEDGHYVKMGEYELDAILPLKIKSSIKNNKIEKPKDFTKVKATVTAVVEKDEIVEEVKADAVEAEIAQELLVAEHAEQVAKNIEAYALELKLSDGKEFEVKALQLDMKMNDDDEEGTFVGYGAVFGNVDQAGDVIKKGAFRRTLNSGRKVKMFWQHDRNTVIGVFTEMYEDEHGLALKGQIALDVQKGREAYSLLKMGALDGLSIGYEVTQSTKDKRTGVRNLTELKLHEVSVVSMPCNELATVTAVKSINKGKQINLEEDSKDHSSDDSNNIHSLDDSEVHSDSVDEAKSLDERLERLLTNFKGTPNNGNQRPK